MEKRERKPNENIQVFVRLRPSNAREKAIRSMDMVEMPSNKEVVLRNNADTKLNKKFTFDRAFGPESKQNEVYAAVVSPMIEEVLSGYNCTVFAYGQTGTGKTHTMVGEEVPHLNNGWEDDNMVGMVPRAVNHLFDELRMMEMEFSMRVSYLELYNEECFDLLSPDETTKIRIFEDKKGGIIVHGLEEIPVHSKNDVYKLLGKGQEKRRTAPTLMNAQSSRSHTIFSIVVHMKDQKAEGEEMLKIGKLNLVDLAGSENISKAGNEKGVRARETVNINQSLLTLGRVMTALVEHQPHVPYRESKLTRLLQESLGGRTKTSIIATISPGHKDYDETANTLDYAHRAKNIQNRPEVNQRLTKKTVIKEFTEEIDRLKRDLMAARNKDGVFLTEDSYNELMMGQESTTKELNEKVMQIRAVKEQMAEKERLFTEVSLHLVEKTEELKTTQENLKATGTELLHTQTRLQTTDEKYRQQRFLLKHHEHTERKLQGQAKDLLQVANTATSDVSGLHEMVDRRRGVDAENQSKLGHFPQRIEGQFRGFSGNGHHFLGEVRKETDGIKYRLDESLAEARKHAADLTGQLSGMHEMFRAMSAESLELFTEMRSGMEGSHRDICVALESLFVKKQQHFEETLKLRFGTIAETAQSQIAVVDRIEGFAVALAESVGVVLSEGTKSMGRLYEEERKQTTEIKAMMAEMQQKWQALEQMSVARESLWLSTTDSVTEQLQQNVAQNRQAQGEAKAVVTEVLGELGQVESAVNQRSVETATDSKAVELILVQAKEAVNQARDAFEGRAQEHAQTYEGAEARARNSLAADLERSTEVATVTQMSATAVQHKADGFVNDYDDFAANCLKSVKNFCSSELETYRPTGETPAKKNFMYPQALSQTSPHGRILQRFRYDPNNSFNSSSDILPGLEDDETITTPSEPNIAEAGEGEERAAEKETEEEEAVFEDARAEESPQLSDNAENENPNVQRKKRSTTGMKAANRPLLEVQQRDTIYVSSDDVSGKGSGRRAVRRSPLRTKSPANGRSPLLGKSPPVWRNS